MNSQPDGLDALPLDELQIAPEWVKSAARSYESHTGEDRERKRDRREWPPRDRAALSGAPRDHPTRGGPPKERGSGRPPRSKDRRGPPVSRGPAFKPQPAAIAPVDVSFLPEDKGWGAMIETMRHSQRAYALFDIAKLILNKPERHLVKLARKAAADGSRGPLFLTGGEHPSLSQEEATRSIFRRQKGKTFTESKKPVDPPKGNFTFVNRCGITGEWLGPPNYHEYQARLVRHHQQRLRHIPFEEFKARIQTVRDPEAVRAWIESKSYVTEYECLLDTPPQPFTTRQELEKHVVENHLAQLVTAVPELVISGPVSRQVEQGAILEAVRLAWQAERRFPLKTANQLSERLRKEGFHFFKHNKGITYISPIKPKRFETTEGLSGHVQKLVTFLRTTPGRTRKQVVEHFVPPPAPGGEGVVAQSAVGVQGSTIQPAAVSPEEERLLSDLHWLIQDGYVVEFSDGRLWALNDKPSKPPAPAPATEAPAAASPVPSLETTASPPTPEQVRSAAAAPVSAVAVEENETAPAESQSPSMPEKSPEPVAPSDSPVAKD